MYVEFQVKERTNKLTTQVLKKTDRYIIVYKASVNRKIHIIAKKDRNELETTGVRDFASRNSETVESCVVAAYLNAESLRWWRGSVCKHANSPLFSSAHFSLFTQKATVKSIVFAEKKKQFRGISDTYFDKKLC